MDVAQRYRHVVRLKARAYFLAGGDRDDVVREGMIGLYQAIRDYDPTRQTRFQASWTTTSTTTLIKAV